MHKTLGLVVLLAVAGCKSGGGGAAPDRNFASGELIAELDRVFAPMNEPLSAATNVLEIDVSRALYIRFANPARSQVHQIQFEPGPPSTYRYKNLSHGTQDLPLKFVIGKQTWLVTQSAIVRVHSGPQARFELRARGDVIIQRPRRSPEMADEIVVRDASWKKVK